MPVLYFVQHVCVYIFECYLVHGAIGHQVRYVEAPGLLGNHAVCLSFILFMVYSQAVDPERNTAILMHTPDIKETGWKQY